MDGLSKVFRSGAIDQFNARDDRQRLRETQRRNVRDSLLNKDHPLTRKHSAREPGDAFSPRSGRQHKAWGANPRIESQITMIEPAKRAAAQNIKGCRPLRGLERLCTSNPKS